MTPPGDGHGPDALEPDAPPEPDESAFDAEREPLPALKSSGFHQVATVIGGAIAGVEQQVFGRRPPGEIEVRRAQPTRGRTDDGTTVTLEFPETAPKIDNSEG